MVLGRNCPAFRFCRVDNKFSEMGTFFSDRLVKKGSVMLAFVV
jgi:hypothetical protein